MHHLEAPDKVEFERLYQQSVLKRSEVFIKLHEFYIIINKELHHESIELEWLIEEFAKNEFYKALHLKINHALKSLVMINFYESKIKSDENWMNDHFKVFPEYDKDDFGPKLWFDYFSDNFFIQISSSFDLIGHILNNLLRLKHLKPDFESVINCLNQKSINKMYGKRTSLLFKTIKKKVENQITSDPDFKKFKIIRNDAIHNLTYSYPFNKTFHIIDENNKIIESSVTPTYIKATERIEIINSLSNLFIKTLDIFITDLTFNQK